MRTIVRKRWYFAPIILLALAAFGWVTMLLWNALLPMLFHFPVITFWQAAGLLVLLRLLFGGGNHHRGWHRHHWDSNMREKWRNMTPEEREGFYKNLRYYRDPCGFHAHESKSSEPQSNA